MVPLAAFVGIAVREGLAAAARLRDALSSGGASGLVARAPHWLVPWLRRAQSLLPGQLDQARGALTAGGRWALMTVSGTLSAIAHFGFQLAMMLIAFFFLLRDGQALVGWIRRVAPLPGGEMDALLAELRSVARSVLGASVASGAIQGALATIGFEIARAPSPAFFGLLTFAASFVPRWERLVLSPSRPCSSSTATAGRPSSWRCGPCSSSGWSTT